MEDLLQSLTFCHGPAMKNRFMLAPLTNCQSHPDGRLSDDEFRWLVMRAAGGFGLTMTCAAHVQAAGQGFPGQLGVFSDDHVEGLTRLASAIAAEDSVAVVQLHHAGMRSPSELIGTDPVCPSADEKSGARAMTADEVQQVIEDFVAAAARAERCGFHGVEVHGAHGYLVAQFLSAKYNRRTDDYGGSLENRARLLFDILEGIRQRCGSEFSVGLRLSPERFGQTLTECRTVAERAMVSGLIDYLDMSLWDYAKEPHEEEYQGRSLSSYFVELDRGKTRLGVAGKIYSAAAARQCLSDGYDFVTIGRGAILHNDFPKRVAADSDFVVNATPVSQDYLREQGLSETFIKYLKRFFKGFVA